MITEWLFDFNDEQLGIPYFDEARIWDQIIILKNSFDRPFGTKNMSRIELMYMTMAYFMSYAILTGWIASLFVSPGRIKRLTLTRGGIMPKIERTFLALIV